MYLRLPTSFAVIYASFTLGFYVAIQGPTLMDLIDLLHINNDIMSYSLAFASLAYSVGGLLSGFLFNFMNRQILIVAYLTLFGLANIVTPFIGNYMIFSVITVFKMMCAGGVDCGGNVWMLEMWPGKDSWLQALHFAFATGCALGPLIVEPFLQESGAGAGAGEHSLEKGLTGKSQVTLNEQNGESRIYIPYGVSGLASIAAALYITWLLIKERQYKAKQERLRLKQQAAAGEHILLGAIQHPDAMEAGEALLASPNETAAAAAAVAAAAAHRHHHLPTIDEQTVAAGGEPPLELVVDASPKEAESNALAESARFLPPPSPAGARPASPEQQQQQQQQDTSNPQGPDQLQVALAEPPVVKITSRAREQTEGRPPYYVMLAVLLSAMCLSFYCGIEITSMNYLATFAVNIDLQLNKSTAALMSSALTISFAVGRAFGILIAIYMKPQNLFYMCTAIMAIGNVSMLIFANTAERFLWYSICVFGVGCGPMFPAIVSFFDDRISKVTNTVSGIFILGSMFNVALNSLIIGHQIIDNALILIVCNLVGSVVLLLLFGTLHILTKVKKQQRVRKFKLKQQRASTNLPPLSTTASAGQANSNSNSNTREDKGREND